MLKKVILAVPAPCFWAVIGVCLLGIGIGSFCDLDIGMAVANRTKFGSYFAACSPILAYALLPAGGACLFVGLKKKGDSFKPLAWTLLLFGWFMAVYYSDGLLSFAGWLVLAALFALLPFAAARFLDDSDPDRLIAVGAALFVATFAADAVMQWLKQIGSRPRPSYLFMLENPASEFRGWWQMIPHLAGSNDNYLSWPSGHMSIVSVLFALPLLTDCMKIRSTLKPMVNLTVFFLVCIFILCCGYNRLHMTNHFLSDVCFGTLNTCLITAGICTVFLKALPAGERK